METYFHPISTTGRRFMRLAGGRGFEIDFPIGGGEPVARSGQSDATAARSRADERFPDGLVVRLIAAGMFAAAIAALTYAALEPVLSL